MTNYTKTTNFATKDTLPSGNANKIVKGTEIDTEFNNIATAVATKADTAGPTLTGTTTFETLSDGSISITAFVDEDNMASDSATLLPTQQSVKAYVDSQVTAQDLDFQADSGGALSIDLDSETLTFTGGTGVDTSGSGNAVTFAIDSTVATLTGSQTLSNKTLATPVVSGNLTTNGLIDGRDVATDGTKLDGIEASADVTDTANVTAAGALMDSELTSEASVKALNQGVATTDSPTFAGLTTTKLSTTSTGIDVTGTVTADGGTIDGALSVNTAGNLLTLNATSGVAYQAFKENGTNRFFLATLNGSDGLAFIDADGASKRMRIDSIGDISFYEDTGTTAKFFWDASAESLGIGTSPSTKGHFYSTTSMDQLSVDGAGAIETGINFKSGGTTYGQIYFNNVSPYDMSVLQQYSTGSLIFGTNDTERLRIDSSGNVGIGTNSPTDFGSGFKTLQVTSANTTSGGVFRSTNSDSSIITQINSNSTGGSVGTATSHPLVFTTANTERMRIDSTGRVGIGTTSPANKFVVAEGTNQHGIEIAPGSISYIQAYDRATSDYGDLRIDAQTIAFATDNGLERMRIGSSGQVKIANGGSLNFDAAGNGNFDIAYKASDNTFNIINNSSSAAMGFHTSSTERMRIDSSGNLLVGTTSASIASTNNTGAVIVPNGASQFSRNGGHALDINRAQDGEIIRFRSAGNIEGSISISGSTTTYNTSSDQRLKNNIVDAPSASDDIDAIQVRSFDWKADGSHQKYGMVAQELQGVAPEAVSAPEDPDEMMGVDYSKLVPMMLKEIQSLRARVQQLENN